MLHFRDDYARADVARRREFERLHNGAPVEPMYPHVRNAPLRHFALCGIGLGLLVLTLLLAVGR